MLNPTFAFDYAVRIPEGAHASLPWTAQASERIVGKYRLLAGRTPSVALDEFEVRRGVPRTRVRFISSDRAAANLQEVSFVVDRGFTAMLRAGDSFHAARNSSGAFGVSVLRDGRLIAAAGSVHVVPLGNVRVSGARDLVTQAEAIFQARDPKYQMWESPVDITIGDERRLLHVGRVQIGGYEVFVLHGFRWATECAAISLVGVCPDCAATLTAPIINSVESLQFLDPPSGPREQLERESKLRAAITLANDYLAQGNLAAAHVETVEALRCDPDSTEALRLLYEIGRRRP